MTEEKIRKKAEEILRRASLTPILPSGETIEEYRQFWRGVRNAFWELLFKRGVSSLPSVEFPLPWEEQKKEDYLR